VTGVNAAAKAAVSTSARSIAVRIIAVPRRGTLKVTVADRQ
jgi:hypothetical protein